MTKIKYYKFIFPILLVLFSILVLLNFTVKNPNDGVLYLTSAMYFVENNLLIDTTRTVNQIIMPFPTTQVGITFYLVFLIHLFKNFWIFIYILVFTIIWVILLRKLYFFGNQHFSGNKYLAISFPFLIFLNYDYLISASSFYNETLYYPFLIFSFLKIINSIKKNKNFFKKSILFSTFLAFGTIFRMQHLVLLGALGVYFLIYKKFKEFFYICFFVMINLFVYVATYKYLQNFNSPIDFNAIVEKDILLDIIAFYKYYISHFSNKIFVAEFDNSNIILKNFKAHFNAYSNFTNFPKIVDLTLPKNGKSVIEFIYILISILIIFHLYKYFKNTKIDKIKMFLLIFFIVNSIFLFFLTDVISRYFLFINFCIIFFLGDSLRKIPNFNLNNKKYYIAGASIFFIILIVYGTSYFFNYRFKKIKTPTFKVLNIVKDFKNNRNNFFSEDDLFISRFSYTVKWVTDKSAVNSNDFIRYHKKFDPNKKYFFIGSKKEFYDTGLSSIDMNVDYIENYLFNKIDENEHTIWRIHLKN